MAFKDLDLVELDQANGGWGWGWGCGCPSGGGGNPFGFLSDWVRSSTRGVPLQSQVDPFYGNGDGGGASWGGGDGGGGGGHCG